MEEYEELYRNAKLAFKNKQIDVSLCLLKSAYELQPSESLKEKIEKMESSLAKKSPNITQSVSRENKHRQEDDDTGEINNQLESSIVAMEQLNISKTSDSTYDKNYSLSKTLFKAGKYKESYEALKICHDMRPSENLAGKLEKIKKHFSDLEKSIAEMQNLSIDIDKIVSEKLAESKEFFKNCDYEKSLELLNDCYNLKPTDKLKIKIDKLKAYIDDNKEGSEVSPQDVVYIKEKIYVDRKTHEKLYDYQQAGIKWLSELHYSSIGGILADDMGLGKTVQISTFILAISNAIPKASFLIVMPVSLVPVWTKELQKWAPSLFCFTYQGASSKSAMNKMLKKVQNEGGIVLTTYGTITANAVTFRHNLSKCPELLHLNKTAENSIYGPQFEYTYTILDEGHKIKNPAAKCTKALLSIQSNRRLVLTGTAVQNNLTELWSLFNYVHCGKLLGTQATFKREYSNAIEHGRAKDASSHDQHYGKLVAESLRKLINPFFLRRTKNEVLSKDSSQLEKMSRKDDLVIWTYLTEVQERIYRDFLSSDEVKYILMGEKKSPLVSLTILKKLCDHPRLLSRDQCEELELENDCFDIENNILNPVQIMRESNKIEFTVKLMDHLLEHDHKVLVFSLSLKLLNMLQIVMENLNENKLEKDGPDAKIHRICRLDGRIKTTEERGQLVEIFERSDAYTCMFLTTQVGGVGLTLTSADRVIILDPSWNPAVDAQAVDRAYRIGQKKDVIVYRLITCSSVEEKIYRRQVFKQAIIRQTTGGTAKEDLNSYRYFSHQEIRDLFTLDPDVRQSPTQLQLATLHAEQLKDKPKNEFFENHLKMLKETFSDIIHGISHHDLLFTKAEKFDEIQNPEALNQARMMAYQSEQKIRRENNIEQTNPNDPYLNGPQSMTKTQVPVNPNIFKPNELQNRQNFKTNVPINKPIRDYREYLMANHKKLLDKKDIQKPFSDDVNATQNMKPDMGFSTPKNQKKIDSRPTPQDMKNPIFKKNDSYNNLVEISSDESDHSKEYSPDESSPMVLTKPTAHDDKRFSFEKKNSPLIAPGISPGEPNRASDFTRETKSTKSPIASSRNENSPQELDHSREEISHTESGDLSNDDEFSNDNMKSKDSPKARKSPNNNNIINNSLAMNSSENFIHPVERSAPKIYLSSSDEGDVSKIDNSIRDEDSDEYEAYEEDDDEDQGENEEKSDHENNPNKENREFSTPISKIRNSQYDLDMENMDISRDLTDHEDSRLDQILSTPQFRKSIHRNLNYDLDSLKETI